MGQRWIGGRITKDHQPEISKDPSSSIQHKVRAAELVEKKKWKTGS